MLIKFTSDMDYVDFTDHLEELGTDYTSDRDELEVKVDKDNLIGTMEAVAEAGLEIELYHVFGAKIEDWHDD